METSSLRNSKIYNNTLTKQPNLVTLLSVKVTIRTNSVNFAARTLLESVALIEIPIPNILARSCASKRRETSHS